MIHILMFILACQTPIQEDEFWYGPLGARSHAVFQLASVGFVPDAPTELKSGTFELQTTLSSINVFNNSTKVSPFYLADFEFERLNVDAWYAISDRWQIGIEIPIERVGGGVLDGFIMGFHNAFGIDQGGRTDYRKNTTTMVISGHEINVPTEVVISDIMLITNYKIFNDPNYPGLMVGAQVKLPTATNSVLYSSYGPGIGLSINTFYRVSDWYFNLGASMAMVGDCEILDQSIRPYQETLFVTAEKQILNDVSIVAQAIGQSGIAKDFGQYSTWSLEVDVGFKFHIHKNAMLEIGMFENAITYANSADFGVFMSLILR